MGDVKKETVRAADAIKFLECACRNWSKVPRLSDDDIQDVAEELERFLALRQPNTRMEGGGEPADAETRLAQLDEIADGAWGDNPMVRGKARDEAVRLRTLNRAAAPSSPTVGELDVVAWLVEHPKDDRYPFGERDVTFQDLAEGDIENGWTQEPLVTLSSAQSSIQRLETELSQTRGAAVNELAVEIDANRTLRAQLEEARKVFNDAFDFLGGVDAADEIREAILPFLASLGGKMQNDLDPKGLDYATISRIVFECRERQKATGEGDQMLSRWISEALSGHLSAVPDGEGELVEEVAWALATELGRQDRGEPFNLDENLEIAYLDQGKVSFKDLAKAALAASRLSQAGVRVKPLEWSSEPPYSVARVSSLRLLYSIEAVWDEGVFQYVELRGGFASGDFPTVDAAKAAAQADYETRIRSALSGDTL